MAIKKRLKMSIGLTAVLLLVGGTSSLLAADRSNWTGRLSGSTEADAGAATVQDTGVIGMSTEDLQSYAAGAADDVDDEVPDDFIRNRRRFVIREMRFNSDWDTDPTSLPALIDQFKRRTSMDAQALLPRKPMDFSDPEILHWPFLFMTAHNAFTLSEKDVENLRKYLSRGGFLMSDDCLYGFPFGPAFHGELVKVFPDKTLKPIDPANPVFGTALKQKYSWTTVNEAGLPSVLKANAFESIDVDGHMVVMYTPPDLGCCWEISSPPTPSNPLGAGMHSLEELNPGIREAAYRMGINVIFYAMTH